MRHKISGRKFNRRTSQRMALLNSLARSLLSYEKIVTTLPKAKDIRPYVEKMLTLGKHGTIADRRALFARLRDNDLVAKVFGSLAERYKDRQGGYTRIIKCGFRKGDMAPQAIIELVKDDDFIKNTKLSKVANAVSPALPASESAAPVESTSEAVIEASAAESEETAPEADVSAAEIIATASESTESK